MEGDDDDGAPRALVRAGTGPPRLALARTLEEASPRTLVYIDGNGQVRSPARYRALSALAYGSAAAITAGSALVYGALLGAPGLLVGVALALYYGWLIQRARLLRRAAAHLGYDQLDEAETLLRRVTSSRLCNKNVRALAWHNLAPVQV